MVALAGPIDSPQVIDRRRVEIADPAIRGSKQPFHAAEPMGFEEAVAFLKRCTEGTSRLAVDALESVIEDVRARGYKVKSFGVTLGSGRTLPGLEAILASHTLIHTAEGKFYRDELMTAAKYCGLHILGIKERELYQHASVQFHMPPGQLERRIAGLGKPIGPPWSQDQKCAALAAWLALGKAEES
jgi:hypothetical protein